MTSTNKGLVASAVEWVRASKQNQQLATALGAVLVVVLGASLFANLFGGDDGPPLVADTITSTTTADTTPDGPEATSEVPPVDCGRLITSDEAFEALDVLGGMSQVSQSEVCHATWSDDESFYVQIGPGSPNDFAPGAIIIGVTGDTISDLGDEAIWFGGPEAEDGGAYGVVAVRQATQHGDLYYRVVLGRPNVDEATQREITIGLARTALPRFPGVVIQEAAIEFEFVEFPDDPAPDPSAQGLAENLLAKEEAGDWSRGEGLAATLRYMLDDAPITEIHTGPELVDNSGSLIIELAREYVESGDDETLKGEIQALLDSLTINLDDLQSEPVASELIVSRVPLATEEQNPCGDNSTECLDEVPLPSRAGVPDGKYTLWADLINGPGWQAGDIEAAKVAILDSAAKYEALGSMPSVTTVLRAGGETLYVDYLGSENCVLYISEFLADFDDDKFQQIIAREMAFCLIASEFNTTIKADQAGTQWWTRGVVNYLSGYVYPSTNLEHEKLPGELASHELSTTLAERTWTNWIFFEYLHGFLGGPEAILSLLGDFPPGGDHIAALADADSMDVLFHDFERALTDANVGDQGPGTVPYEPIAWELDVFGPLEASLSAQPFGVRRLQITVPDGMTACFTTTAQGEMRSSWRTGVPGEPGTWDEVEPTTLQGDHMLVVTAVKPGSSYHIQVTDVSEDPDCEDDEDSPPTTLGDCGLCPPSQYYYKD
jgi:hypothetical protein